jgi:NADPH:quinone reductase
VDMIAEVSPTANSAIDSQVLANAGSIAVYANNGGTEFTVPIRANMTTNARWQFVLLYTAPHEAKIRAIEDISAALLDGAVRVGEAAGLPLIHFPLEATAEAHAAVEKGAVGKVLIDVAD